MKREQSTSYLVFILSLSILGLVILAIETVVKLSESTRQVLTYFDYAVCLLFFIDFLILFFQAENKGRYFITWGWLDLLSSIPAIEALRLGRAARIVRIFRVFRSIKSAKLITRAILEKKAQSAVLAVILVSIVLVAVSSISILHFESSADGNIKTAEDAVWWSMVTITTVGYGDKFPVTTEGRVIATLLMIAGVGIFGTISGFVASTFITPPESEHETLQKDIHEDIEALRKIVEELQRKSIDENRTENQG